jgi:hypothetical protein
MRRLLLIRCIGMISQVLGGPLGRSNEVGLDNSKHAVKGSVKDTQYGAVMTGMELRPSIAAAFRKLSFGARNEIGGP